MKKAQRIILCLFFIVACFLIIWNSIFLIKKQTNSNSLNTPQINCSYDDNKCLIKWKFVEGANYYRIYLNDNNSGWKIIHVNPYTTNYYEYKVPNQTECFRIKIKAIHKKHEKFIESEFSNTCTIVKQMKAPTLIQAVYNKEEGNITVNWSSSITASGYHLFRRVNNGEMQFVGAYSYLVTSIKDKNISTNKTYSYYVRSINFWVEGDTIFSGFSTTSSPIIVE